jgi:hypothetical protein
MIHVNSNNFYVLADRDGAGNYGDWDGNHPLQLEADTENSYVFGNQIIHAGNIGSQSVSYASNAGTLDGIDSSSFVRSDANDTITGDILINTGNTQNGIRFRTTSGDFVGRYSDYVSLYNQTSGAEIRMYDSDYIVLDSPSVRAPIMYDSNNTAYYSDPASTSNLYTVSAQDAIRTDRYEDISGNFMFQKGTNAGTTSARHLNLADTTIDPSDIGTSHVATGITWGRRTDNNPYYIIRCAPAYNNGYSTHSRLDLSWHTGVQIGAASTYGGTRFFNNSSFLGSEIMRVGSGNNNVYINYTGEAGSDFRAPIFYDSNNTGYYVDPASTSVTNTMQAIDFQSTSRQTSPRWDTAFYVLQAQHWYGDNSTQTMYVGEDNYIHLRDNVEITDDVRCPIYYDRNDTTYYVDPASTATSVKVRGTIQNPSIWINDGDDYNGYNENIRLFNAPNGVSVIGFSASGVSGTPTTSILGYSDRLETRYENGWQTRVYNGYAQANGSYRAPIFYDSNNTGYYLDPSSTTSGNLRGNLRFGDYGVGVTGTYTSTRLQTIFNMGPAYQIAVDGSSASGAYGLYWSHQNAGGLGGANNLASHGILIIENGSWKGAWGGGSLRTPGDVRAPIFYDYNNTGYYCNPAGTSRLERLDAGHFGIDNTSDSTRDGISLYGGYTSGEPTYGILFTGTSLGTHGSVTGSWATYFTMNNDNSRGWIFRRVGSGNAASISAGGVASFNGDVIAYYSDMRLKTKLGGIEDPIGKIQALNGFYYEPNEIAESYGYEKETRVGLSAQEVEAVLPEIVTDAPIGDGYKTVDYAKLVPVLVEAIKEQQKQIDELKELVSLHK